MVDTKREKSIADFYQRKRHIPKKDVDGNIPEDGVFIVFEENELAKMKANQVKREAFLPQIKSEQPNVQVNEIDFTERIPDLLLKALTKMEPSLQSGQISEALVELKQVKEQLMDGNNFSGLPINLGLEYTLHQAQFPYRQDEINSQTGELYAKVNTFVRTWNEMPDPENETIDPQKCLHDRQISFREKREIQAMSQQIKTNGYKPIERAQIKYLPNAQAMLYSYFSTMKSYPIYMTSENFNEALELITLSLELGGFPLLDVVFEADDKDFEAGEGGLGNNSSVSQVFSLQRALLKENFYSYKKSVLHLLAESSILNQVQIALLERFLQDDSFQRANLTQLNFEFKSPLTVAIENSNIDFIQTVCNSNASLQIKWSEFLDTSCTEVCTNLIKQFTPGKQTALGRSTNADRFQIQLKLLKALKGNIETRIEKNQETPAGIIEQMSKNQNLNFFKMNKLHSHSETDKPISRHWRRVVENERSNNSQEQIDYMETDYLRHAFVAAAPALRFSSQALKDAKEGQGAHSVMLHVFTSPLLKSGYLLQQLILHASVEDLRQTVFQGIGNLIYNQVTPLVTIDNTLTAVEQTKLSLHFPFRPGGKIAYCFGLKLAMLYQPENKNLHEFILSQMDFDAMGPYLLEVMCFVGKYLGTKNKYFTELFNKKVWLMGANQARLEPLEDRNQTPTLAKKFYTDTRRCQLNCQQGHSLHDHPITSEEDDRCDACSRNHLFPQNTLKFTCEECNYTICTQCSVKRKLTFDDAYDQMIICVGEVLIQNHEVDQFYQFFYSQNCLYMTSEIVTVLLGICFQYMIPECAVPIYAFCGNKFEYLEKNKHFSLCDSDATVSEQQIQSTLQLIKAQKEVDSTLQLSVFLKSVHSDLADRAVNMVLDHNLTKQHLMRNEMVFEGISNVMMKMIDKLIEISNINEHINSGATSSYRKSKSFLQARIHRFRLMLKVYDHCSIEVAEKFIKRQYETNLLEGKSTDPDAQIQRNLFTLIELTGIFSCTLNQESAIDQNVRNLKERNNHENHHQREGAKLAKVAFKQAVMYPEHAKLIQDSRDDKVLASEITDRLGISPQAYDDILQNTLAHYKNYEKKSKLRYHYWEIGSGASDGKGQLKDQKPTKVKVRAAISKKLRAFNVLEEIIQWRKFNKFHSMVCSAIDALPFDYMMHFFMALQECDRDSPEYSSKNTENNASEFYNQVRQLATIFVPNLNWQTSSAFRDVRDANIMDIQEVEKKRSSRNKLIEFNRSYKFLMFQPLYIQMLKRLVKESEKEEELMNTLISIFKDHVFDRLSIFDNLQKRNERSILQTVFRPFYIKAAREYVGSMYSIVEESFTSLITQDFRNHCASKKYRLNKSFEIPFLVIRKKCPINSLPFLDLITKHYEDIYRQFGEIEQQFLAADEENAKQKAKDKKTSDSDEYSDYYDDHLQREYDGYYNPNEGKRQKYLSIFVHAILSSANAETVSIIVAKENALNLITIKQFSELLKRSEIPLDLKVQAINKFVQHKDSTSTDSSGKPSSQHIEQQEDSHEASLNSIMYDIARDGYFDFKITLDDLDQMFESQINEKLLLITLKKYPGSSSEQQQIDNYHKILSCILEKCDFQRLDNFLHELMKLLPMCKSVFDLIYDGFKQKHPEGLSLLQVEFNRNGPGLFSRLIEEGRFEAVQKIKELAQDEPYHKSIWDQSQTPANHTNEVLAKGLREDFDETQWKEMQIYWTLIRENRIEVGTQEEIERNEYSQNNSESESSKSEDSEHTVPRKPWKAYLPCFAALKANQIQLCKDLIDPVDSHFWKTPDLNDQKTQEDVKTEAKLASTQLTKLELLILIAKVQTNWINSFQISDEETKEKLKSLMNAVSGGGLDPFTVECGALKFLTLLQAGGIGHGLLLRGSQSELDESKKLRNCLLDEAAQSVELFALFTKLGLLPLLEKEQAAKTFKKIVKQKRKKDAEQSVYKMISSSVFEFDQISQNILKQTSIEVKSLEHSEKFETFIKENIIVDDLYLQHLKPDIHVSPTLPKTMIIGMTPTVINLLHYEDDGKSISSDNDEKATKTTWQDTLSPQTSNDQPDQEPSSKADMTQLALFWFALLEANGINLKECYNSEQEAEKKVLKAYKSLSIVDAKDITTVQALIAKHIEIKTLDVVKAEDIPNVSPEVVNVQVDGPPLKPSDVTVDVSPNKENEKAVSDDSKCCNVM